jgi:hypothetical protein
MIALVAILAIFAVALLRALLREIDVEVARQEVSTLKSYQEALQASILREGNIPDPTMWADMIATNTGAQVLDVLQNKRRQNRILLVDPSCNISLPYIQGNAGMLVQPVNVRMMLVSSLGQAVFTNNGAVLSPNNFAALWNATEGTATFPGWAGRAADVRLQRLDLTPLFVKLYVTTQPVLPQGWYAIGTNAPSVALLDPLPPVRYILQGTVLRLYHANGALCGSLDSTQVMNRRGSFKYENGVWKGDPSGAVMPGGVDLAAVVRAFLDAVPNMNSQAAKQGADPALQQRLVVQAMMDYMRNYNTWADGNFQDNNLKALLINLQSSLISTVQGLYLYSGNNNNNYYPLNNTPCP